MPNPPNNNDLQRERVRFLNRSLSLQNIIRQGSIANGSRDNVVPALTPFIPVSPSVTPTNTKTPTPSITNTPTITITQTPTISITPSSTLTPTITPTPTTTPTVSITPTITPTISITPTITPTVTPTPVQLLALYKDQDILLLGLKDDVFDIPSEFDKLNGFNLKELNGLYRVETFNQQEFLGTHTQTLIRRYNIAGQQLPVFSVLSGQYADNTWRMIFEMDSQGNTGSLFIGPSAYGSTLSLPVSNFSYDDLTVFSDQPSIQDAYVTDNFTNPTIASSAIMIRGLSSSDFNFNTLSGSINGVILYRVPGLFNNSPRFSATNVFGDSYLIREIDLSRNPSSFWSLILIDYTESLWLTLTSANNQNTLPFSGFNVDPNYTSYTFLSTNVNSVRLIAVDQDNFVIPPPTPSVTPTISITPSITPTISITPSITPTNTVTPTQTPTVTPTPSITPTITPTITVTSTVNIPDSVPVWSTNAVQVYDPEGNWSYLGSIYNKQVYEGVPTGLWRPGGGDNGLYPPNYGYENPYDRWVFHNTDGYSYLIHPEANNPDFIPKTGWPGGVTLSAYS